MKITVRPILKLKNQVVPFDEIPVGYVYVIQRPGEPVMLKLCKDEAVLLNYGAGLNSDERLKLANDFKGLPTNRILGKLTEIIVEKE